MPGFHRKIFYLGACFALGMILLMVRFYSMQVIDQDKYLKRTEATRVRNHIFYPPRARILDRDGRVLAENESVWDVSLDLAKLTDPRGMLARAQASPELYPDLETMLRFHQREVKSRLEKDYPAPRTARRFFALWELRQHELCVYDREVVLDQLSSILRERPDQKRETPQEAARLKRERLLALQHQIGLISMEVDGIIQSVGDFETASGSAIYRAWLQAREALSDLEYWERIRRFPKSLDFEPALAERIKRIEARAEWVEQVVEELERNPDNAYATLLALYEHAEAKVEELLPPPSERSEAIDPVAEASLDVIVELQESLRDNDAKREEALRDWRKRFATLRALIQLDHLPHMTQALKRMLEPADVDTIIGREALDERFFGERGSISRTQDRLRKLRERVIEPYSDDFTERWIDYLSRGPLNEDPLLTSNPLTAARRVPREAIEVLELHAQALPGVVCSPRTNRVYHYQNVVAQHVGGLALPDQEALDMLLQRDNLSSALEEFVDQWFEGDMSAFRERFRYAIAQHPHGVSGIERAYDERLTGLPGAQVVYADATGSVRAEKGNWDPVTAPDLTLTLDTDLQEFAVEAVKRWEIKLRERMQNNPKRYKLWELAQADPALNDVRAMLSGIRDATPIDEWSLRGALVMLDVETGGILAMVNYPTFNAELARSGTDAGREYYQRIVRADAAIPSKYHWLKRSELLNRAVAGRYAPGSTMKVMSSVALLESGAASPHSVIKADYILDSKGYYKRGGVQLRTAHPVWGDTDVEHALKKSSNEYYWHFSLALPGNSARERYENVFLPWAKAFGFGEPAASDLSGQSSGNLPDPFAVDANELAQNMIGQGKILATPLQVANLMAIVARRGKLIKPHMAEEAYREDGYLAVSDRTWKHVHRGMRKVVESGGTADASSICREIGVAGKTGTAQTGYFIYEEADPATGQPKKESIELPDHAWFAGFAPYDKPKVAFAVLGEYSGLYGGDLADLAGELVEYYLDSLEDEQANVKR